MSNQQHGLSEILDNLKLLRHRENELISALSLLIDSPGATAVPEHVRRVFELAKDAFNGDATRFLINPHWSLNYEAPLVVAQSAHGAHEVEVLLARIMSETSNHHQHCSKDCNACMPMSGGDRARPRAFGTPYTASGARAARPCPARTGGIGHGIYDEQHLGLPAAASADRCLRLRLYPRSLVDPRYLGHREARRRCRRGEACPFRRPITPKE